MFCPAGCHLGACGAWPCPRIGPDLLPAARSLAGAGRLLVPGRGRLAGDLGAALGRRAPRGRRSRPAVRAAGRCQALDDARSRPVRM